MQISAYLNRIGYDGSLECSAENLAKLLRCHLEQVPFENLDFYDNPRELPLDTDSLFDKIVTRRRGGVCCELNTLFGKLLAAMGYECYPVLVRIVMPGPPVTMISHQGIVARADGKRYYCDVGFGGPGPKGLVDMDTDVEQVIDGKPFRVLGRGLQMTIQGKLDGNWTGILQFADVAAEDGDFQVVLYYATTRPGSYFLRGPIVNLCLPDGYKALTGNRLTVRRGDDTRQRTLETEAQLREALREEFGL